MIFIPDPIPVTISRRYEREELRRSGRANAAGDVGSPLRPARPPDGAAAAHRRGSVRGIAEVIMSLWERGTPDMFSPVTAATMTPPGSTLHHIEDLPRGKRDERDPDHLSRMI
ncbi:hypothetical protein ACQPYK_27990 [Streptosporangium sp. CA-135522]|uniref:hypothetical protein n=1 Tax=Streptosporangium sp. CA-135522 TaxID=3240072 RepID=UPI003D8B5340